MQANFLTTLVLPIALGIIMLGMGLSLELEDFKRVKKYPKAVALGLFSQLLILPIIGFIVAKTIPMQPEIAIGLIIIAICPGGPSSNLITFLAKGDVALSVTLTAFSSVITVFTIPLLGNLAYQHFIGETAQIALPIGKTILQIFLMTLLPISLGMGIKQKFPKVAISLEKTTNILAALFLAIIIILLIIREWNRIPEFIIQAGLGVIILNVISMLTAFNLSKLFNLSLPQKICIAIEVGIQNGTLAIAITTGLLNNPDMAIPAAVYSLFMNITGFIAILYGRKLTAINAV
jgi:bile acid:Na+ symporter, BASS family